MERDGLSPLALALLAASALVILAFPANLPHVIAACGSTPGTSFSGRILRCGSCWTTGGQKKAEVTDCTVFTSDEFCEITASVTLWVADGCKVYWQGFCDLGFSECGPVLAAQGPFGPQTVVYTHGCNSSDVPQETVAIELQQDSNPDPAQNTCGFCSIDPFNPAAENDFFRAEADIYCNF